MGDQVRQRGGGGDNPLIIDLGSSQRKQPQSNLGGKVRGGTQKHAFGAFMPIIVVIGCIGIAALVGVIAIIGTNSYVTREIAKTENSDHLLIENTLLKEQLKILEKERANQPSESTTNTVTTNEKADRKIKQLITYKARMHQEIQTISKRQLYEKYGKGPYKVQIDVEFDPSSNIYSATKSGGKIIIQMADANDMPATVYLFLEQVTKGLMSGCSFHRNGKSSIGESVVRGKACTKTLTHFFFLLFIAHHVLQGGPASNFIHTKAKHHDFKEANLDGVPFQE